MSKAEFYAGQTFPTRKACYDHYGVAACSVHAHLNRGASFSEAMHRVRLSTGNMALAEGVEAFDLDRLTPSKYLYPQGWNFLPAHGAKRNKLGAINDSPYLISPTIHGKTYSCPIYRMWYRTLNKDCSPDWLRFMDFRDWFWNNLPDNGTLAYHPTTDVLLDFNLKGGSGVSYKTAMLVPWSIGQTSREIVRTQIDDTNIGDFQQQILGLETPAWVDGVWIRGRLLDLLESSYDAA